MKKYTIILALLLIASNLFAEPGRPAATILCPADAPAQVRLAAQEVRRYVYLRTGELLPISPLPSTQPAPAISLLLDAGLGTQEYRLKGTGKTLAISGGSETAVLYGAYAFAEKLGVRFYLHGDVVPDGKMPFQLPPLDETKKPFFELRGLNPWGSHPFGFDAWGTDDYKAVITQLAKMRMNFIGMHCYPEGHPYAEPTVWLGPAGDFDAQGRVKASYVSRYYNTLFKPGWGGYAAKKTADYDFGAAQLFEDDAWAPEVMRGNCPEPKTPEACNEVFNRMGTQFGDAFSFARSLGVKTCLGTEAPITLPRALRDRLKAAGKNPDEPAVKREIYEGVFKRIAATHPLDYYWIWTEEGWTWGGNKPEQYQAVVADIRLAIEAAKNVKAPFRLATCGWVLGPAHDRAALDNDLPKEIPTAAISRQLGYTEVDPAFGRIKGRDTWSIPWLESDGHQGLAGIQLVAGRMRRDAVDSKTYGCTGLMGLQWRTDSLAPNAAALAQAAWDQSWNPAGEPATIEGKVANYPDAAIAGTPDAPLYRSCRYDLGTIQVAVPNGNYQVTLKFCEPHFKAAGQRIFDVQVQGETVLANLDIFAKVGSFAAFDFTAKDVAVTDGRLTVKLAARTSLPCISAIAIEGAGISRKINCGGPAYQDWQADAPRPRSLPVDDFYADFAQANFGLAEAGKVFAAIDGQVPLAGVSDCPAMNLPPAGTPWAEVAPRYAFVDAFAAFRPQIQGTGNLARFDYWLNTFKYYRALAQTRCAMGAKNPDEVMACWTEAYTCLLATVGSPGTLAMVVNMENKSGTGPIVAKAAGKPFPKEYQGAPRLIVPCVRSVVTKGEVLTVKILALDRQPVKSVTVHLRPLGQGEWRTIDAKLVTRGVWNATFPAAMDDFEYQIVAKLADVSNSKIENRHSEILWPATVPEMNQTVVVMEK